jgi:hypothetical protein
LLCDKQHTHAPWTPTVVAGKVHYPTHTEAAYPEVLCQRIVSIVLAKVLELGAIETETLEKHVKAEGKSLNRIAKIPFQTAQRLGCPVAASYNMGTSAGRFGQTGQKA